MRLFTVKFANWSSVQFMCCEQAFKAAGDVSAGVQSSGGRGVGVDLKSAEIFSPVNELCSKLDTTLNSATT